MKLSNLTAASLVALGLAFSGPAGAQSSKADSQSSQSAQSGKSASSGTSASKGKSGSSDSGTAESRDTGNAAAGGTSSPLGERQYRTEDRRDWGWLGLLGLLGLAGLFRRREQHHDVRATGNERVRVYEK